MIPLQMKALVTNGQGGFELKSVDVPIPGPNEILVKVVAVAQNPKGYKAGNIIGIDFSGIVAALGSDASTGPRQTGERVAGALLNGGKSSKYHVSSAFAEYLVTPVMAVISLPDEVPFEEATRLGLASHTKPAESGSSLPMNLLIWGGATSTGQIAIQLAKLSGLHVISSASKNNFALLKSLGADDILDYTDVFASWKIRYATGDTLTKAVDCMGEGSTATQVIQSLSPSGGEVATLLPYRTETSGVTTQVPECGALPLNALPDNDSILKPDNSIRTKGEAFKLFSELLGIQKLKLGSIKLYPDGPASVEEGLRYMKLGEVRKICFSIDNAETLYVRYMPRSSCIE
ncbi:chaperonin 10-like protein [Mycena floridula]|nr:chaperonin 10-like protein [Mycena floridula]